MIFFCVSLERTHGHADTQLRWKYILQNNGDDFFLCLFRAATWTRGHTAQMKVHHTKQLRWFFSVSFLSGHVNTRTQWHILKKTKNAPISLIAQFTMVAFVLVSRRHLETISFMKDFSFCFIYSFLYWERPQKSTFNLGLIIWYLLILQSLLYFTSLF